MFGFRSDGKAVGSGVDSITRVTPYIMPQRNDATNMNTILVDEAPITAYVREKRAQGVPMSTMSVFIAAYVRTIAEMPELNRFVVSRKLYARKYLSICFVLVHNSDRAHFEETNIKIKFKPSETVLEVAKKIDEAIEENSKSLENNATSKLVDVLLRIPGLLEIGVPILKFMDKIGILPASIIDASPFHTSCFITNMASVRIGKLYHHLYNFGTTSQFMGLGEKEKKVEVDRDGNVTSKWVYPVGVVTDERVASGAFYAMAFRVLRRCLQDPHIMETPPESVRWDCGVQY